MITAIHLEQFLPFMVRFILGSLFFFQAYDKLFRIGMGNTYNAIHPECRERNIPDWMVKISIWGSTYIELIGGVLLILGFYKPLAMLLLGINLMMVTVALSYLKGLWSIEHVFPRVVLLIVLYFIPLEWDAWTLDSLFNIKIIAVK